MEAKLLQYIDEKLISSKYYFLMAKAAPMAKDRAVLEAIAADELSHAKAMAAAFELLTRKKLPAPATAEPTVAPYKQALENRILAETYDYGKFGVAYLKAKNPYLKDLFYNIQISEGQHAIRLLLIKK